METLPPDDVQDVQESDHLPELILNEDAQYFLHTSGRWAVFLGIMGFIMSGLMLLCAIFISTFFSMIEKFQVTPMPAHMGGIMGVVYFLIALFYFFCSLYLYQFGDRIKSGITYNSAIQVSDAVGKLKSLFKLWGIFTISVIVLYVLILIGVVIGAAFMHR